MSGRTIAFRRPDTGETKVFRANSYTNDTTTMRSTRPESVTIHFYEAADGDRIDQQPDGSCRDKWGVVWQPV
jgi:hypothetical protein